MAHADSLRIKISIASMHILTSRILDVSNAFKNTNVPIHERVCASPPPYYLDYLKDLIRIRIQGTNPSGSQWNRLLDAVVKILDYKKITIDHAIYIKVFSDITVSYPTVSTDDFLNTTNNDTSFTELTRVFLRTILDESARSICP